MVAFEHGNTYVHADMIRYYEQSISAIVQTYEQNRTCEQSSSPLTPVLSVIDQPKEFIQPTRLLRIRNVHENAREGSN